MNSSAAFAGALLDPSRPPPDGLSSWNGSDVAQRFGIHRNNVVVSLIDALAVKFPVVQALVGEAFFRDAARVFARACPPRSPRMMQYGDDFPNFLDAYEPAKSVPYLGDVARLERARVEAYHAADDVALAPSAFADIAVDALDDMALDFHPSVRLLASRFAVFSLWAAHQGTLDIGGVDPFSPEDALVFRPKLVVETIRLSPGEARFFGTLLDGGTLGDAAVAGSRADGSFDIDAAARLLVTSGVATSLIPASGAAP